MHSQPSRALGELIAAKTTLEATPNALPDAVFVVSPDATLVMNTRQREMLEAAFDVTWIEAGQLRLELASVGSRPCSIRCSTC